MQPSQRVPGKWQCCSGVILSAWVSGQDTPAGGIEIGGAGRVAVLDRKVKLTLGPHSALKPGSGSSECLYSGVKTMLQHYSEHVKVSTQCSVTV